MWQMREFSWLVERLDVLEVSTLWALHCGFILGTLRNKTDWEKKNRVWAWIQSQGFESACLLFLRGKTDAVCVTELWQFDDRREQSGGNWCRDFKNRWASLCRRFRIAGSSYSLSGRKQLGELMSSVRGDNYWCSVKLGEVFQSNDMREAEPCDCAVILTINCIQSCGFLQRLSSHRRTETL